MLYNIKINDEKQAKAFINDVLKELGKGETEDLDYSDNQITFEPVTRPRHVIPDTRDITIENSFLLNVQVDDLDFSTQEIINKHKNKLHRL